MKKFQARNGTCRSCAFKVYKPEQRFRLLRDYMRKGWQISDIAFENNGQVHYEIYTLQRHEEKLRIYYDVTDFLRLF